VVAKEIGNNWKQVDASSLKKVQNFWPNSQNHYCNWKYIIVKIYEFYIMKISMNPWI
jgi:hypothetical protein